MIETDALPENRPHGAIDEYARRSWRTVAAVFVPLVLLWITGLEGLDREIQQRARELARINREAQLLDQHTAATHFESRQLGKLKQRLDREKARVESYATTLNALEKAIQAGRAQHPNELEQQKRTVKNRSDDLNGEVKRLEHAIEQRKAGSQLATRYQKGLSGTLQKERKRLTKEFRTLKQSPPLDFEVLGFRLNFPAPFAALIWCGGLLLLLLYAVHVRQRLGSLVIASTDAEWKSVQDALHVRLWLTPPPKLSRGRIVDEDSSLLRCYSIGPFRVAVDPWLFLVVAGLWLLLLLQLRVGYIGLRISASFVGGPEGYTFALATFFVLLATSAIVVTWFWQPSDHPVVERLEEYSSEWRLLLGSLLTLMVAGLLMLTRSHHGDSLSSATVVSRSLPAVAWASSVLILGALLIHTIGMAPPSSEASHGRLSLGHRRRALQLLFRGSIAAIIVLWLERQFRAHRGAKYVRRDLEPGFYRNRSTKKVHFIDTGGRSKHEIINAAHELTPVTLEELIDNPSEGPEGVIIRGLCPLCAKSAFESSALSLVIPKRGRRPSRRKIGEASDVLLLAIRADLHRITGGDRPNYRLYDLLAGMAVRYDRVDYLVKLINEVKKTERADLFSTRIRTWRNPASPWYRLWTYTKRPIHWAGQKLP